MNTAKKQAEREELARQQLMRIRAQTIAWFNRMIYQACRQDQRRYTIRDAMMHTTAILPIGGKPHRPFAMLGFAYRQ
jgi:hypothetical protein